MRKLIKPNRPRIPRVSPQPARQRASALAGWDNEGGASSLARRPLLRQARPERVAPAASAFAGAELMQLRIRVMALENLVITLLAEGTQRQLDLAQAMAAHVSPRPGFTRHRMTIQAAAQMVHLAKRARHFRAATPAAPADQRDGAEWL